MFNFSSGHRSQGASSDVFYEEREPEKGLIDRLRNIEIQTSTSSSSTLPTTDTPPVEKISEQITSMHHVNEALETDELIRRPVKQVFVVSENGKPIFTRYGDEDHLVTLMGVMQTLVSLPEYMESNELKFIKAGRSRISFFHCRPLILVAVSHINEPTSCLTQQLSYAYNQIISQLTSVRIEHRLKVQPNFDLRSWFSFGEKQLLHNILDKYDGDLGLLFESVRSLPLPQEIRDGISQTVTETIRGTQDLVFALITTDNHLVTLTRRKSYFLSPIDIHLLMNLVNNCVTPEETESWIPICLPRFDPSGMLHAHISGLDSTGLVRLILLTVNPEHFQILSNMKNSIRQTLQKLDLISVIKSAVDNEHRHYDGFIDDELTFFAYKSLTLRQYVRSPLIEPYANVEQRNRLFERIRIVYARCNNSSYSIDHLVHRFERETIFQWVRF